VVVYEVADDPASGAERLATFSYGVNFDGTGSSTDSAIRRQSYYRKGKNLIIMCQRLTTDRQDRIIKILDVVAYLTIVLVLATLAIHNIVNIKVIGVTITGLEVNGTETTGWCYYRLSNKLLIPSACQNAYQVNDIAWLTTDGHTFGLHQDQHSTRSMFYIYCSMIGLMAMIVFSLTCRPTGSRDSKATTSADY
jgi:hypothetical protein